MNEEYVGLKYTVFFIIDYSSNMGVYMLAQLVLRLIIEQHDLALLF